MITVFHIAGFTYSVNMDKADWKAVDDLAKAYAITHKAMLVSCINKGIDVIGKQVKAAETPKTDKPACDDIC